MALTSLAEYDLLTILRHLGARDLPREAHGEDGEAAVPTMPSPASLHRALRRWRVKRRKMIPGARGEAGRARLGVSGAERVA